MRSFPNPTKGKVNLELRLPKHLEHQIDVYNIRGQKVRTIVMPSVKGKSVYEYDLDLRNMASGLYIIRLKMDNKTVSSKKITVF
ncbi:MAG: T9SS type A sorting domain-containing protein [Candidatus Cloacimonetes bacterium]|nr:T9SS type A sorting domain-containing protein [Candidatus Cloacimonadota bacterium]